MTEYLKNGRRVRVDLNTAALMKPRQHGIHKKDMVVLHETVSPDYAGLSDVLQTSRFLASKGLGIHGVVDGEGNLAWAVYMDAAVLWHVSSTDPEGVSHGANSRSIGIEQVSRVMLDYPDNRRRFEWWWQRDRQIDKVAKVLAHCHRVHGIPLEYSNGDEPGITTHWSVSKTFDVSGGHVDCWPRHLGGYYPVLRVIHRARQFHRRGY